MKFMLGCTKTSDIRKIGARCHYPSPIFLSKNQLPYEGPSFVAPVVIPALAPPVSAEL